MVDFVYNNNSVYYESYMFWYSTLGIPVLYPETVSLRVQSPEGSPQINHSDWRDIEHFLAPLIYRSSRILLVCTHNKYFSM